MVLARALVNRVRLAVVGAEQNVRTLGDRLAVEVPEI
jgi:hypothetical protein